MIEELATVVARDGGRAWVQTNRRGICSACGHDAGCATSVLGGLLGPGATNRLTIEDDQGVCVGERVVIGIPDALLVRASVLAYLPPLVALVACAGIAESLHLPELAVAGAGIAGLGLGLWLTGRLTGGPQARRGFSPVLLRREPSALRVSFQAGGVAPPAHRQQQTEPTTEVRP